MMMEEDISPTDPLDVEMSLVEDVSEPQNDVMMIDPPMQAPAPVLVPQPVRPQQATSAPPSASAGLAPRHQITPRYPDHSAGAGPSQAPTIVAAPTATGSAAVAPSQPTRRPLGRARQAALAPEVAARAAVEATSTVRSTAPTQAAPYWPAGAGPSPWGRPLP